MLEMNWRLRAGAHDDPRGGSCLVEFAVILSGQPYRKIAELDDIPAGFCRAVSHTLICLNDKVPPGPRQQLLGLAHRLPGSADEETEQQRIDLLERRGLVEVVAPLLDAVGMSREARICRTLGRPQQVLFHTFFEEFTAKLALQGHLGKSWKAGATTATFASIVAALIERRQSSIMASRRDRDPAPVMAAVVSIVNAALDLGAQAKPIPYQVLLERISAAKAGIVAPQLALAA